MKTRIKLTAAGYWIVQARNPFGRYERVTSFAYRTREEAEAAEAEHRARVEAAPGHPAEA